MKKIVTFVFAALCFITGTKAQFSLGAKAGINISKEKYKNTAVYSTSSHTWFTGGIHAGYGFSKHLAVSLGVLYSMEGTEESYMSGQTKVNGVVTMRRINVPLLLQYKTPFGLFAETGPQLGLLLSAKGKYSNNSQTYDFKPYTKSALFSWHIGLGYKMQKYVPGLGVEAVYLPGLSRVDKGNVSAQEITASTFSVRLLYAYDFKKKPKK